MASRIGKGEWVALYAITGVIDIIQLAADLFLSEFFGIPEIVSEVGDPIVGVTLVAYFQLRGVSLINKPARIFSLLGVTGLEELTGGLAPAWIVDVWYIQRSVRQEEAELAAQKEQEELTENMADGPLVRNGARQPRPEGAGEAARDERSFVKNGVGRPRGRPMADIVQFPSQNTDTRKAA